MRGRRFGMEPLDDDEIADVDPEPGRPVDLDEWTGEWETPYTVTVFPRDPYAHLTLVDS
jgi:hypothetical protein